ncbi:MAG: molybdenum cofactor biosynthesis protein MoaE [Nitrososphaerota archaeon]|nr:molybdenum cofactor biosynthesis protein MoaE [Nitrososphaerota archaeon]
MATKSRITTAPIDPARVLASVTDPAAGGTVLFLGTVRNSNEGRPVRGLEYQVYREMAEKRMVQIEGEVKAKWPVRKISMVHRYGKLGIGDISVAVAVSAPHRAEAFEACRYAIDTVKRSLPLWKKEAYVSGKGAWVKGDPIRG